ncbi:VCBS repeat-containing protein [Frigidibacter sp. MR17.14]|uniref:FG-GAP repeat domain-containing protein n=1 Tax=Frigidibacter sp. MR17.14 TaxID=3126509 RepID=UPI003012C248
MTVRALVALLAGLGLASPALAEPVVGAVFEGPVQRYGHKALGGAAEWSVLRIDTTEGVLSYELPKRLVFEDLAPRLADLDGDGAPEVIVVESDRDRGSRLAVWGPTGRIAATDFIGNRFRWLAPAGIADFDGDGRVEIAYVETPHLRYLLKLVRLEGDALVPVAEMAGVTNHRFGDAVIQGGVVTCPGPALRLADPTWGLVRLVAWDGARLAFLDLGSYRGPASLDPARGCRP